MIKRDPNNLPTTKICYAEIALEVWQREGILISFLTPPHRYIEQTPDPNGGKGGYRYERALPACYPVGSLIKRIQREVGDVPFTIILPDGSGEDPKRLAAINETMISLRNCYRQFYHSR